MIVEDSLLERVTAAAEERKLSHNSLLAYRRTWLKIIAWSAAEGLVLETLLSERGGEFYEEATRGRSASHHLQVKAALALFGNGIRKRDWECGGRDIIAGAGGPPQSPPQQPPQR